MNNNLLPTIIVLLLTLVTSMAFAEEEGQNELEKAKDDILAQIGACNYNGDCEQKCTNCAATGGCNDCGYYSNYLTLAEPRPTYAKFFCDSVIKKIQETTTDTTEQQAAIQQLNSSYCSDTSLSGKELYLKVKNSFYNSTANNSSQSVEKAPCASDSDCIVPSASVATKGERKQFACKDITLRKLDPITPLKPDGLLCTKDEECQSQYCKKGGPQTLCAPKKVCVALKANGDRCNLMVNEESHCAAGQVCRAMIDYALDSNSLIWFVAFGGRARIDPNERDRLKVITDPNVKSCKAINIQCSTKEECCTGDCQVCPKDVDKPNSPLFKDTSCREGINICMGINYLSEDNPHLYCTENGLKCLEDDQCCSKNCANAPTFLGQSQKRICTTKFICSDCIPAGEKIKEGQKCCETLYNVNGRCVPDFAPAVPIKRQNQAVAPPATTSLFSTIADLFFPQAMAQALVPTATSTPSNQGKNLTANLRDEYCPTLKIYDLYEKEVESIEKANPPDEKFKDCIIRNSPYLTTQYEVFLSAIAFLTEGLDDAKKEDLLLTDVNTSHQMRWILAQTGKKYRAIQSDLTQEGSNYQNILKSRCYHFVKNQKIEGVNQLDFLKAQNCHMKALQGLRIKALDRYTKEIVPEFCKMYAGEACPLQQYASTSSGILDYDSSYTWASVTWKKTTYKGCNIILCIFLLVIGFVAFFIFPILSLALLATFTGLHVFYSSQDGTNISSSKYIIEDPLYKRKIFGHLIDELSSHDRITDKCVGKPKFILFLVVGVNVECTMTKYYIAKNHTCQRYIPPALCIKDVYYYRNAHAFLSDPTLPKAIIDDPSVVKKVDFTYADLMDSFARASYYGESQNEVNIDNGKNPYLEKLYLIAADDNAQKTHDIDDEKFAEKMAELSYQYAVKHRMFESPKSRTIQVLLTNSDGSTHFTNETVEWFNNQQFGKYVKKMHINFPYTAGENIKYHQPGIIPYAQFAYDLISSIQGPENDHVVEQLEERIETLDQYQQQVENYMYNPDTGVYEYSGPISDNRIETIPPIDFSSLGSWLNDPLGEGANINFTPPNVSTSINDQGNPAPTAAALNSGGNNNHVTNNTAQQALGKQRHHQISTKAKGKDPKSNWSNEAKKIVNANNKFREELFDNWNRQVGKSSRGKQLLAQRNGLYNALSGSSFFSGDGVSIDTSFFDEGAAAKDKDNKDKNKNKGSNAASPSRASAGTDADSTHGGSGGEGWSPSTSLDGPGNNNSYGQQVGNDHTHGKNLNASHNSMQDPKAKGAIGNDTDETLFQRVSGAYLKYGYPKLLQLKSPTSPEKKK
ncbi:MAG: hypothetical protein HQK50_10400 [Oligoflexia bacterium]|nr:hypothetical protein [Oligoflexia bacterium]MBF0365972.1 hypothetical protein [Oligoflexia bacterium]